MKRIVLIGNNTIAVECLEYMVKQGTDVVAVLPEPGDRGEDGWQKSLRKAGSSRGLNVLRPRSLTDSEFLDELRRISPDIIFSVQCRRILKRELISIPKHGVINLHLSMLPRYRGCYPIAWAVINGEKETGVTLHYIDEGIDTGDIISQQPVEIKGNDTARHVFDRCVQTGLDLFRNEFRSIMEGSNQRRQQDDTKSLYYPIGSLDFKDNSVRWDRNHITLHNWIRGFTFPPFQYPHFIHNNRKVEIVSLSGVSSMDAGKPGEVVDTGPQDLTVSALGGNISIGKVRLGEEVIDASLFARNHGIGKGLVLD